MEFAPGMRSSKYMRPCFTVMFYHPLMRNAEQLGVQPVPKSYEGTSKILMDEMSAAGLEGFVLVAPGKMRVYPERLEVLTHILNKLMAQGVLRWADVIDEETFMRRPVACDFVIGGGARKSAIIDDTMCVVNLPKVQQTWHEGILASLNVDVQKDVAHAVRVKFFAPMTVTYMVKPRGRIVTDIELHERFPEDVIIYNVVHLMTASEAPARSDALEVPNNPLPCDGQVDSAHRDDVTAPRLRKEPQIDNVEITTERAIIAPRLQTELLPDDAETSTSRDVNALRTDARIDNVAVPKPRATSTSTNKKKKN
jgi:hypothetical protein